MAHPQRKPQPQPQPQPTHQANEAEPDGSDCLSAENPSQSPNQTQIPTILHLSFNPDHARFSVATDMGFRLYSCDPVLEIIRRDFGKHGGVGLVQTLFRWQFLAIVGGGPDTLSSSNKNKVMIWNDNESRFIGELSFRSEVKGVKCRRDQIIVVLVHKIYVYNFRDLKLLYQIETIENPTGLCEVSHMSGQAVLVCPGLQKGQVRVDHHGTKQTKFIVAHESPLTRLALSQDARLLATASNKGTLIRIFNTLDGSLLQEVRRGAERAEIYSLAFSSTAKWLALSSNKGTVHVFNLKVDSSRSSANGGPEISVPNSFGISSLSVMKGVLPKYFSSEWSMAKYHLQEGLQYIVGFGHQKNTVLILGIDGSFHRCQFDPVNGGVMTQLEYCNFLKPEEAL